MLFLNLCIGPSTRPVKLSDHTVWHRRSVRLCRRALSFKLDLIDPIFVGAERCEAAIAHQTNVGQSIEDGVGCERSIRMQSVPLGRPLWEIIRHSVFLKLKQRSAIFKMLFPGEACVAFFNEGLHALFGVFAVGQRFLHRNKFMHGHQGTLL